MINDEQIHFNIINNEKIIYQKNYNNFDKNEK